MEKILSIIIPTYNMEEYLSRCVDSLVKSDKIADIEVVIVNDGSKDKSLEIANSYKNQFPDSVVVIDKPNGNYGSTINAALPIITGKYVKILDADDWFDTNALNLFVERLRSSECDMIFTPYTRDYLEGKNEVCNISGVQENRVYDFETFMSDLHIKNGMKMHMVAYRNEVVTTHNYKQTEGISYTDNEWIFYPLYYVNSIEYIDINLYQHFIGRGEQTTDPKVRAKNYWQEIVITTNMLKAFNDDSSRNTAQYKIMLQMLTKRVAGSYASTMKGEYYEKNVGELSKLKDELLLHPSIKDICETYTIGWPIKMHAVRYWNQTGQRYPQYILFYLRTISKLRSIITNS